MKKKIKIQKGITLIALVITIIILIILAGISIRLLTGENGILLRVDKAKNRTDLVKVEENKTMDNYTNDVNNGITYFASNEPEYEGELEDESVQIITEINPSNWTNQNVKALAKADKEGYTIRTSKDGENWNYYDNQEFEENGKFYARAYKGKKYKQVEREIVNIDKIKPTITSVTATTKSITIQATDNESGIVGYGITTTDQIDPTNFIKQDNTKILNVTIQNQKQETKYYVWVKDEAGNISDYKEIITKKVPSNITMSHTPTGWTNQDVTVTASTTTTGFEIEISKDKIKWEKLSTISLSENGPVYARLYDGINYGASATKNITNIDKVAPSAEITLSSTATDTRNSITATITQFDSLSGVNINKCKWVYDSNSTEIGTDENIYTGGTFSNKSQTINLSQKTAGTYYLHVLTVDNAGNKVETISNAITIKELKVGDYINYSPDIGTIEILGRYSGSDSDQTFTTEEDLRWRIYSINDDGTIDIISETETSDWVWLFGASGYNNGVTIFNDICNKLYSNSEIGATARSIKMEDIYDKLNPDGYWYVTYPGYNEYTPVYSQSDTEYGGMTCYPDLFQYEKYSIIDGNQNSNGIGRSESYKGYTDGLTTEKEKWANNIQSKITTSNYTIDTTYELYTDYIYADILNKGRWFWIASRSLGEQMYNQSNGIEYNINCFTNKEIEYEVLWTSNGGIGSGYSELANCLRPIVKLNANTKITATEGTENDPHRIE